MGKDELRRALNEASSGPERDFTDTWTRGRRVRRRRQTAQGLGVTVAVAAAVGAFALGGGNLLGEDATIEPLPPATQTVDQVTDEPTEVETTDAEPTGAENTDAEPTGAETTEGAPEGELPGPDDPLPTTVEDYATTFVAAGVAGDAQLFERMGADFPVDLAADWADVTWEWDSPVLSDADTDLVGVTLFGDESTKLELVVERGIAESGAEHGVVVASLGEAAMPDLSLEEYADELVRLWPQDDGADGSLYATSESIETLAGWPADGSWERVDVTDTGPGLVAVTYAETASGAELIVTVERVMVELREPYAVVHIEYFERHDDDGDRTAHPCDEAWSRVPPAGTGNASGSHEADLKYLDLFDLATACDLDGLIALAEQDGTMLSLGGVSPQDAFAGQEGRDRVQAIALLLSEYQPEWRSGGGQTWAEWPGISLDRLDELVELGLYTQEEVDGMREYGSYLGWRITIAEDGTWLGLTAGE